MLSLNDILFVFLISFSGFLPCLTYPTSSVNLILPDPEAVVQHVQSRINASVARRRDLLFSSPPNAGEAQCLTGNPIDDCWRCDPDPAADRQRLADCAVGFGRMAAGGKGGGVYVVHDSSDEDPVNPAPGTLRHAVVQDEPLWIVFETSMMVRLKRELIFNSFKTVDGRGADVHITGYGCVTLQHVSNVIIHNVHIYGCRPSPGGSIRSSPSRVDKRGGSDGDGISIMSSRDIWIDHCAISRCTDGLIDVTLGSTAVTISNSHFSHHDKVMLLGHSDNYSPDSAMQVTIGFNYFGEGLVQRMPRCRWGYVHVVNNDFTEWQMYAIGGSASPTINSQGNRYIAPLDTNAKEVTKRVDTSENEWRVWNWRTEGDILVNGAFFVPSGDDGATQQYAKASSVEPKSGALVDQLTVNAGVLGGPRDNEAGMSHGWASPGAGRDGGDGDGSGDLLGMIFGSDAPPNQPSKIAMVFFILFVTVFVLHVLENLS